jgi:hypothetical protein
VFSAEKAEAISHNHVPGLEQQRVWRSLNLQLAMISISLNAESKAIVAR